MRCFFFFVLLLLARWNRPHPVAGGKYLWSRRGVIGAAAMLLATLWWVLSGATSVAWIAVGVFFLGLLWLDTLLAAGLPLLGCWVIHLVIVAVAGIVPVLVSQITSHFADEEFFVSLQGLVLSFSFALCLLITHSLKPKQESSLQSDMLISRRYLLAMLIGGMLLGGIGSVRAYQRSFYPRQAPIYPGITSPTPFLCGDARATDPQIYDGMEVFERLLARVEANPHKGAPEYGMLALGTGEQIWADAFRETLLAEAAANRFAGPANSVKSTQYEAALRVYYYPRVQDAFPGVFSEQEESLLGTWFANINKRALTVEWVDWLYALAFTKWPEGPYENQENGAGLLSLLEVEDLAAPESRAENQRYLEQNPRGWQQRFHNTDDALIYQLEWLNNAYFQSLYTGAQPEQNLHLSFEWLLLQSLPDGTSMGYNHPAQPSLAGMAYLGAVLVDDPRYIWLSGRAIERLEATGGYLSAQPGVEAPIDLVGHSPTVGTCLLYSDSGLPNQQGPLAPDKIVFRDGWREDDRYLLLNLRFTGWHRYKATNALSLFYKGEPLVQEITTEDSFDWLPVGRSLFRDKRIPRENLNGFLIPRTGLGSVLQILTGIGSRWAQDPPYYATVEDFQTGDEFDYVHTRVTDWHGWQHDRWIYFYDSQKPIVIFDEASGTSRSVGAFAWHLVGIETIVDQRVTFANDSISPEIVFLSLDQAGDFRNSSGQVSGNSFTTNMTRSDDQQLFVTLILPDTWTGASVELHADAGSLMIFTDHQSMSLQLPSRE